MAGKQKGFDTSVGVMKIAHDKIVYMVSDQLVWLPAINQYGHPGEIVDLQPMSQDEIDVLRGAGVVVAVEFVDLQDQVVIAPLDDVTDLAGIARPVD